MRSALIALFLLTSTTAFAQTPRVFLTVAGADASGFSAPGEKERTQVLKDLTSELKKKKSLQLVPSAEQADVTLELTNAGIGASSNSTSRVVPYSGSVQTTTDKAWHATAQLRAGSFKTEFSGSGTYSGTAARAIASDVDKWIIDNRSQFGR